MAAGGISAAFRLVAAACAWPRSADRLLAIQRAAADVDDWAEVVRLVRRHRVEGLVWSAFQQAGVEPAPAVAAALAAAAREVALRNLRQAAESGRVQAALREASIASLVLKGAAVEQIAYGRLGLKNAWDVDLLVAPADVPAAIAVLDRCGYDLAEPAGLTEAQFGIWMRLAKEAELHHRDQGHVVELHWRLADGPSLLPGIDVRSSIERVELSPGLVLDTLGREDLFSYLCVHGAAHGWSRLKWLADMSAIAAGVSPAGLEALWRAAEARGAGLSAAQGLRLAEDLLGLSLPPSLRDAFGRRRRLWALVALARRAVAGPEELDARGAARAAVVASQALLGGGVRHVWAELAYRAESVQDQMHVPLPRRLRFLYVVLRLPLWIRRRLVGRAGP